MKYIDLNEASEKEKRLGELAGIELAHAMDAYARKIWNAGSERGLGNISLQDKYDGNFSKYLLACSQNPTWRKDFFTKYMEFVEQSFDEAIQDLTK